MEPQLVSLKNGLRVMMVDTKTFPSLTALLLVGAGSRFENEKNNGVAHFFEHMAFKGSKKYPTALDISTLLDGLGSEHNAFTSKDHTGYWIKAPTKHFSTSVDILSEMILNPLLKEEEISREKGVIIEEINMYEDQPQYKVWDLFESLLYPDSPLGFDTIGKKETVSKFSRQTFLDYMNSFYNPKNSILIIAGGLDNKENYQKIVEQKFGVWGGREKNIFTKFIENQKKQGTLIYHKKTEQAHLVVGFKGLNTNDPDRYVQNVLMAILGGGMSSRLFYEVRERRGLCYYIQSGTETFNDTGYVFTRAGLNINVKKINEAIKIILGEHQKIAEAKIEDKELVKAKEMIKGRLILSFEDSNNLASFVGKKLMFENKLITPEEVIKKIDEVTKSQVVNLAKKLFIKEKSNLAVIGPFEKTDFKF